MINLIIQGGGSEILEDLFDDNKLDEYKIIEWDMNEDNNNISIDFIDIDYRFNFICDYNLKEIEYGDPKYIPFKDSYWMD